MVKLSQCLSVCISGVLVPKLAMRSAHADACQHDVNCKIGAFQDPFFPVRTFHSENRTMCLDIAVLCFSGLNFLLNEP